LHFDQTTAPMPEFGGMEYGGTDTSETPLAIFVRLGDNHNHNT
jgi:hypothetical protein